MKQKKQKKKSRMSFIFNYFFPTAIDTKIKIQLNRFPAYDTKFYFRNCFNLHDRNTIYFQHKQDFELSNIILIIIFLLMLTIYFALNICQIIRVQLGFQHQLFKRSKTHYNHFLNISTRLMNRFRLRLIIIHLLFLTIYTFDFFYNWSHFYYLKFGKEVLFICSTLYISTEIDYYKSVVLRIKLSNRNSLDKIMIFFHMKNGSIFLAIFLSLEQMWTKSDIWHVFAIAFLNSIIFIKIKQIRCEKMLNLYVILFGICTLGSIFYIIDYFTCTIDLFDLLGFLNSFPILKRILICIFGLHFNYKITIFLTYLFLIEFYKYLLCRTMRYRISTQDWYLFSFIQYEVDIENFDSNLAILSRYNETIENQFIEIDEQTQEISESSSGFKRELIVNSDDTIVSSYSNVLNQQVPSLEACKDKTQ